MRPLRVVLAVVLSMFLLSAPAYAAPNPQPPGFQPGDPISGHAHNDYAHDQPLWDALSHGFTSVEADIFYSGGAMNVGHTSIEAKRGRQLGDLYIKPLADLVRSQGGEVYPCWSGTLQLLVDFKDEPEQNLVALERLLAQYPDVFAHRVDGELVPGPVQVVVSGSRPLDSMQARNPAYTFYDGRPGDLDGALTSDFMPLVSENYSKLFTWQGIGPMPSWEHAKLTDLVQRTQAKGAKLRLWSTPDLDLPARQRVWETLRLAGVDYINTDDLAALDDYLSPLTPKPTCQPTQTPTPPTSPTPTPAESTTPAPGPTPSWSVTSTPTATPTGSTTVTPSTSPTPSSQPSSSPVATPLPSSAPSPSQGTPGADPSKDSEGGLADTGR